MFNPGKNNIRNEREKKEIPLPELLKICFNNSAKQALRRINRDMHEYRGRRSEDELQQIKYVFREFYCEFLLVHLKAMVLDELITDIEKEIAYQENFLGHDSGQLVHSLNRMKYITKDIK